MSPAERFAPAVAMAMAILAVSSSAPLVVVAQSSGGVHPLATAFWRNAIAVAVLVPTVLLWRRRELSRLAGAHRRRCLAAGTALAIHFGTWLPATVLTDVTTAAALVCTQPIWAALFARMRGRRLRGVTWVGVCVTVAGAAISTGAGLTLSAQAAAGNVLALAGGVAGAVYVTHGQRVRAEVSTLTYTAVVYSVAAVLLGAVCLVSSTPLWGYAAIGWAVLGLTALGPQLSGHSMANFALSRLNATLVSVLLLLEVPGAALLGWLLLGQVPPAQAWPGIAVLVAGVAVVLAGGTQDVSADSAAARRG